jgi:hypothetical protein
MASSFVKLVSSRVVGRPTTSSRWFVKTEARRLSSGRTGIDRSAAYNSGIRSEARRGRKLGLSVGRGLYPCTSWRCRGAVRRVRVGSRPGLSSSLCRQPNIDRLHQDGAERALNMGNTRGRSLETGLGIADFTLERFEPS